MSLFSFFSFFLFCWVGELFITHTWTCNKRNHKCQTEGHPQQATLTTWVEADTKVCKGNMSGKTSSPQGSCSPAHSQACSFSTNKASPLSESTQHSSQDHKYNEVPSKASSRQDNCSPSICQARFISLDKRQAHA